MARIARALPLAPAALFAAHAAPAIWPVRLLFPRVTRLKARNAVALTFDDGPDRGLDDFLGLLEEAKARATFFVVGEQVERAPGRLREIVSCGHEVAVHCYRHRNHLFTSPWQVVRDMRWAKEIIEEEIGYSPRLFRPPYGRFSLASWLEAKRQGWTQVLWTRCGRDWRALSTPWSIVEEVGWPKAGDIILLHDSDRYAAPFSWRNTIEALPIILERIFSAELCARPVGELLDTQLSAKR